MGYYRDKKNALPTLRDEVKNLIAFKEFMSFEEVSDVLGEPKRSGKGVKKEHKTREFIRSHGMVILFPFSSTDSNLICCMVAGWYC